MYIIKIKHHRSNSRPINWDSIKYVRRVNLQQHPEITDVNSYLVKYFRSYGYTDHINLAPDYNDSAEFDRFRQRILPSSLILLIIF